MAFTRRCINNNLSVTFLTGCFPCSVSLCAANIGVVHDEFEICFGCCWSLQYWGYKYSFSDRRFCVNMNTSVSTLLHIVCTRTYFIYSLNLLLGTFWCTQLLVLLKHHCKYTIDQKYCWIETLLHALEVLLLQCHITNKVWSFLRRASSSLCMTDCLSYTNFVLLFESMFFIQFSREWLPFSS